MGEIGPFGENLQSEKCKQYNADPIIRYPIWNKKNGSDAISIVYMYLPRPIWTYPVTWEEGDIALSAPICLRVEWG